MTQRIVVVLAIFVFSFSNLYAEAPGKKSMALGDTTADLVYTPLPLCRIIDTRLGSGPGVLTTTLRPFYVAGSTDDFPSQGGTAGGCGVPNAATAVVVNFVAVGPQGAGNLRGSAWPLAVPATGSILNYQALTPGLNIANAIPMQICNSSSMTCDYDIYLRVNGASTHLVGDVAGYFRRFPTEQVGGAIVAGAGLILAGNTISADFAANGTATKVARSDHKHYVRTVIVSPAATPANSGTALRNALDGITDADSDKRYLLKIEPGTYQLSSSLQMKSYVDIEGSGQGLTRVVGAYSGGFGTGTLVGASSSELRMITVERTGGVGSGALFAQNVSEFSIRDATLQSTPDSGNLSITVNLPNTTLRLSDSRVIGSGVDGANWGIYTLGGNLDMDNVVIDVDGDSGFSGSPFGIAGGGIVTGHRVKLLVHSLQHGTGIDLGNGELTLTESKIELNTEGTAYGIRATCPMTLTDTSIRVIGDSASDVYGLHLTYQAGNPVFKNFFRLMLTVNSANTPEASVGIHNQGPLNISESRVLTGGLGIKNVTGPDGTHVVTVENSRLVAPTNTVSSTGHLMKIATTRLEGGPVAVSDVPPVCVGAYNGAFAPLSNTCS